VESVARSRQGVGKKFAYLKISCMCQKIGLQQFTALSVGCMNVTYIYM